ncbi:GerAB/ArcD/ProY family transporter [Cohnella fermenti]|uniref:Uncharacterized protein n=1 Tax=Cohnella fermenti TaxID=2565925 RepID=A0A4S4BNT6_9BACL|nr:endospore germination permease [Cohnella fermenti]THF76369.1 hypothetical protein E6C55_19025 [Cohnella fermenti]
MERISQAQLLMFITLSIFGLNVGFVFSGLTQGAGYASWLCLIVGWAIALAMMSLAVKVAEYEPDKFITQFGGRLVGRWLHGFVMAILLLFFLHVGASITREFQEFMSQIYFARTPDWAIAAIFTICCIYAVRSGIETLFRSAGAFMLMIVVLVLMAIIMVQNQFVWPMARAFVTHWELKPIYAGSVSSILTYNDMILVLFLYPHLQNKRKTRRTLMLASGISLVLQLLLLLSVLLLFGIHLTGHFTYPVLELYRMIRIGDFLDNLDPFFIAIWMTTLILKMSLYLYMASAGIGQLIGLKQSKPLVISVGAIIFGMSKHIAVNAIEVQAFLAHAGVVLANAMLLLPLVYLPAIYIRGKRGASEGQAE